MLLILEIALTIAAWRRGWRFRALIPVASVMAISFFIGAAVGMAGGSVGSIAPLLLVLELIGIAVLIALANRTPAEAVPEAQTVLRVHERSEPAGTTPENVAA